MTHNVLLADIDYARRQLKGSTADATIVAGLVTRGIEPAKAAQLVDDLRNGRNVTPDLQLAFRSRRRRRSAATEDSEDSRQTAIPEPVPQDFDTDDSPPSLKKRLMIAGVVVAALGLGGLALYHYRFSAEAQQDRDLAPVSTNAAPVSQHPTPSPK